MVNSTSRRQFLTLLGATGLSAAMPSSAFAALAPPQEPFTFLFVTDAHLQPELNGVTGRYFHGREAEPDPQAHDPLARRLLHELSDRLCGL